MAVSSTMRDLMEYVAKALVDGRIAGAAVDVIALVGPSHFVGFDGVAIFERGAFETPRLLLRRKHLPLKSP